MSKTKKSTNGHYEILFIAPNKFTEEEAKQIVVKVEDLITQNGGEITYREYWGKKKLAYEIKHNAYGYYALTEFDMEKASVLTLDQSLKLSTDILRHQIVTKHAKTEAEIARAKEIKEKIDAKKADEAREVKEKETKEEADAASKKTGKAEAKTDKRSDLKDLDEKLEGILNANDLI